MKAAFLFPGQGSAAVGMGGQAFAAWPQADDYFGRAAAALGRDLKKITLEGPEETLVATENAQPAIFCLSAVCWDVFSAALAAKLGDRDYARVIGDAAYAGHSLGEYTALYAAGALDFDTALTLVCERGEYIADACRARPGTMAAALGLDDDVVDEICVEAASAGVVVPANYNTPGQVVVSGEAAAVAKAGELVVARGGKFTPLKVSGAFHSPLVEPAAERMRETLTPAAFAAPRGKFFANVTGEAEAAPERIRTLLYVQISRPVRWAQTLAAMNAAGVDAAFEFGHGRVLAGMVKKVNRDVRVFNVADETSLEAAVAAWAD